jgi:putative AdoMet-dependent methyltransferase
MDNRKWDFDQYGHDWIQNYDERMRNAEHLQYSKTLTRVSERASVTPADLVLDIGTGTGNLAINFLQRGCKVIGLDPSARLLELAVKKSPEWKERFQVQLCEDPFIRIPFPEQVFKVIASTFSIHHISDDAKRLSVREMKRALKPNGQIIIGDMMFKNAADKKRMLAVYPDLEDEYQPLLDTFPRMFESEGFTVEVEQMADNVWIIDARLG